VSTILVDSNVILDVVTEDPKWYDWSAQALARHAEASTLAINPLIYAELSVKFATVEELDDTVAPEHFRRLALPWEAAFLAGKCFVAYRKRGGAKSAPLPDFYIGAHAAVEGLTLLTRDAARYRTYFPKLRLIAPKAN
jgi:hypothetical protein